MKIVLAVLLFFAGVPVLAQGVIFDETHSWAQIRERARKENKYILLDCYATWCAPCVEMIKNVFSREDVGTLLNEKFITVKVQTDRTERDNAHVKSWYRDVEEIAGKYEIVSLPTFLFFSPDGTLVHRLPGTYDAATFLKLCAEALEPEKQYFALRNSYMKAGKKDPAQLKKLTLMASKVFAPDDARMFAMQYLQTQKDIFTKENVPFIFRCANASREKGFDILVKNSKKVDDVMWPDASGEIIRRVIKKEEIDTVLFGGHIPQWEALEQRLKKKYPVYADHVLQESKVFYYLMKGDRVNLKPALRNFMKLYGTYAKGRELDQYARIILLNSEDKTELEEALEWSARAIVVNEFSSRWSSVEEDKRAGIVAFVVNDLGLLLNTYALLLHKLGRTNEAIPFQEKAVLLAGEQTKKTYMEELSGMKLGQKIH